MTPSMTGLGLVTAHPFRVFRRVFNTSIFTTLVELYAVSLLPFDCSLMKPQISLLSYYYGMIPLFQLSSEHWPESFGLFVQPWTRQAQHIHGSRTSCGGPRRERARQMTMPQMRRRHCCPREAKTQSDQRSQRMEKYTSFLIPSASRNRPGKQF